MKHFTITFFFLLFIFSCKRKDSPNPEQKIEISANYSNPNGVPSLNINTNNLPSIIKLDNTQNLTTTSSCGVNRLCLSLRNVRFQENKVAFSVIPEETKTYEENSGTLILDVENKMIIEQSRSLDFVLVLDLSSSLGSDATKVKQYAVDFIEQISKNSTNSRVGVVIFSKEIESIPLTSNFSMAKSFIQNKTGGENFTSLFEALNKGLDLLSSSTADGKAILTFTDGINNYYSDPQKYQSNTYIVSRLKQPINGIVPSTFSIGLSGTTPTGALQTQLDQLSPNAGFAKVVENSDELEEVFRQFANSISAVYTLTYNRNDAKTAIPINLKFSIVLKPL